MEPDLALLQEKPEGAVRNRRASFRVEYTSTNTFTTFFWSPGYRLEMSPTVARGEMSKWM